MPEKDGDEAKSTKSVVNKRQKQMMNTEEFSDRQRSDMKNLLTKNFGDESTAKNTAIKVKASRAKEITGQSAVRDSQKYASGEYAKLGGGERMSLKMKGGGAATAGANSTKIGGPKENPKSLGGKSKGNTPVKVDVKKKPDMSKYFGDEYIPEEGYDIARDMGRVRPSKDKKDATTMPPSKEMEKTRKVVKGPSALERVKKKYKGQIMKVEELDLTKVAEAFGGYIIEQESTSRERIRQAIRDLDATQPDYMEKLRALMFGRDKGGNARTGGSGPDFSSTSERTGSMKGGGNKSFKNPGEEEIKKITPPEKKKKVEVTQSKSDALRGDEVTYGQPDEVKPKQGRLSKIATAAAANPAAALIAYDLGKGIIGKIKKLRVPAVVGGKAGFRSAGGYQAT